MFYNNQHLFIVQEHTTNSTLCFDKDESRHILKTLRKSKGDFLYATDGSGNLFHLRIEDTNLSGCKAVITQKKFHPKPAPSLTLAFSPLKSNQRTEWIYEKGTEIGVQRFIPVICKNSEQKKINCKRIEKIVKSAVKQSFQFWMPKMDAPTHFDTFIKDISDNYQRYISTCTQINQNTLHTQLKRDMSALILIGPEGDFTDNEIFLSKKHNFVPVSLGHLRYRSETAAIYSAITFMMKND